MMPDVERIYRLHISSLSPESRLELIARMAEDLAIAATASTRPRCSRISELHGLGKEIWEGIDPDQYVESLRSEWDERL